MISFGAIFIHVFFLSLYLPDESVIDYVESAFDKQIKQKTFSHSSTSSSTSSSNTAIATCAGAVSSAIAAAVTDSSQSGLALNDLKICSVKAPVDEQHPQKGEEDPEAEARLRKKPVAASRASKSKSITELSLSLLNNGQNSSNQTRKTVNFKETVIEIDRNEKHQLNFGIDCQHETQMAPASCSDESSPAVAASVKEKIMLFTKTSKEDGNVLKGACNNATLNTLKASSNKVARPLSQVLVENQLNGSAVSTLTRNGLSSSHAKINTQTCESPSKQSSALSIAKKFSQSSMTSSTPSLLLNHPSPLTLSAIQHKQAANLNTVNNNREPLMLTSPSHHMSSSLVSSSASGLPPPGPSQIVPVYSSAYSSATSIIESQNQHQQKLVNLKDGSMRLHSSASTLNSNTFSSTTCTLTTVKNNNNNIRSQPSSAVSSGLSNIFNTNRTILGPNASLEASSRKIVNFKQQNDKLIINIESRSSNMSENAHISVCAHEEADFEEDDAHHPNFKSVKEKIAYFSAKNASKMLRKSVGDLTNCGSSANKRLSLVSSGQANSSGLEFLLNTNSLFNKMAEKNLMRNYQETPNDQDLPPIKLNRPSSPPANKMVAANNEPEQPAINQFHSAIKNFTQQLSNAPIKTSTPNKLAPVHPHPVVHVSSHSSFSTSKRVVESNANKIELKNMIHTNENKISNIIESIETKFKK